MRFQSLIFLLGVFFFGGLLSQGTYATVPPAKSGLLKQTLTVGNESYTYQLYVPAKLQGQRNLPVFVMLHGIGQRGSGGFVPTAGPVASFAQQYLEQVPAIVLFPQCRAGRFWHQPDMERMVMAEIQHTISEYGADPKRLYLAGVSMGGFGVWHLAAQHPGKFAALVSICGGSPILQQDRFTPIAQKVGRTPVWVFHGSADKIVPVSESRQMVKALQGIAGNQVRYSEYEGVGHDVWMKVLAESQLMPWLFAQRVQ